MSLIFRTSFIVLLITILSKIIFATNCIPSASINYYYWNSPNVVTAEVIKNVENKQIYLKVINSVKGIVKDTDEIIIVQKSLFWGCDEYDFKKGEKYIVFLGEPERKSHYQNSSFQFINHNYVTELKNDWVQSFLELLNNGKPDYKIEGLIWSDYQLKLNKIEVTAKRAKKNYRETFSNHTQYSDFSIQVQEPGLYEVSLLIPWLDDRASAVSKSIYTFNSKIKQIKKYKKQRKIEVIFEVNVEADKFPFFDLRIVTGVII
jgi:hypothetical protein